MYVRPISALFLGGKSTPAMRAILSLPLLMFRIHADDPDHALAVDHLALVTNLFYRCAYLHDSIFLTILPRVRSWGETSTSTRSPGSSRMKFLSPLTWPARCATTIARLFSSSTL